MVQYRYVAIKILKQQLIGVPEWFGNYVVGQRVASHFADPQLQTFIAGDVCLPLFFSMYSSCSF